MERLKGSLVFWALLLVTLAMPASAQPVKKAVYQAKIKASNGITGVGGSFLRAQPTQYDAEVFTHAYPNFSVTKVALTLAAGEIVLCDDDGVSPAPACTYSADGNLDLDTAVNSIMLSYAGISGGVFQDALEAGTVAVELNDGALGSGNYVRIR